SPHRAADGSDLVRTQHPGYLPHDGHCDSVVEGHFAPPLIWQTTDAESVSWAAPSIPSTTATSSRPARSKRPSTSTRWFSSPPDGRTRRTSKRSRVQSMVSDDRHRHGLESALHRLTRRCRPARAHLHHRYAARSGSKLRFGHGVVLHHRRGRFGSDPDVEECG